MHRPLHYFCMACLKHFNTYCATSHNKISILCFQILLNERKTNNLLRNEEFQEHGYRVIVFAKQLLKLTESCWQPLMNNDTLRVYEIGYDFESDDYLMQERKQPDVAINKMPDNVNRDGVILRSLRKMVETEEGTHVTVQSFSRCKP